MCAVVSACARLRGQPQAPGPQPSTPPVLSDETQGCSRPPGPHAGPGSRTAAASPSPPRSRRSLTTSPTPAPGARPFAARLGSPAALPRGGGGAVRSEVPPRPGGAARLLPRRRELRFRPRARLLDQPLSHCLPSTCPFICSQIKITPRDERQ